MAGGRKIRLALDEFARLVPNEWSSVEVRLLECTATGFRAAADIQLRIGTSVTIELPALGSVRAWITWCKADEFAARFATPIDLAQVRWLSLNRVAILARLLGERAAAHSAGRDAEERALRTEILRSLPIQSADEAR
jgi:hypothetical protein